MYPELRPHNPRVDSVESGDAGPRPTALAQRPSRLNTTTGKFAVAAACYSIVAGLASLIGWMAGLPRMTDWFASGISMMPNTAAAVLAAGVALLLLVFRFRRVVVALGVLVGMVGAATLFEHVSSVDLGIDSLLLAADWGQQGTRAPGRMGPPAATSFTIIGTAIALLTFGVRGRRIAATAGLITIAISLLSIVGFLYGADLLFTLPALTAISAQTSTAILALGISLVALADDVGPVRVMRGSSAAGVLVRRALPPVILLPILIGWLHVEGDRQGLYDDAFGSALRTLILVTLLLALLWWAADSIRRHERTLREGEARYSRLLGLMPAAVYMCEAPSGAITYFNQHAAELWGQSPRPGDLAARFCGSYKIYGPDGVEVAHEDCPMAVALRDGRAFRNLDVSIERPDGSRISVMVNIDPIHDDSGQVVGAINVFHDTTMLKRAQFELRESELRFHEMIDAMPTAIYTTDAEGRLTYFNPAAIEFSGRTPELGTDHWCVTWKLYNPDGSPLPHDQCPMAIALRQGRAIRGAEAVAERPDGTRVWFQPYPTPLRDGDGRIVGGINMLVDITERKAGEIAVARLAAIVESSDDAIISKTLDGVITSWNQGAERIFGYRPEEAVGKHITLIIPDDRHAEEADVLARLRRGEKIDHFETERQTRYGQRVHISLTVSPIRDAAGRIVGASKVARDITERKNIEAELAEHQQHLEHHVQERTRALIAAHDRLRRADRMAAVGTLAAGLAHDMKNVLMPLGIRLDAILTSPGLSREASTDLAVVCALLDHLRAMARNLSLFARDPNQDGTEGHTQLAEWCDQVRGFIDASVGSSVFVKWDIPGELPAAGIAPHRLTQAVLNLVHNARDAILATSGPLTGTPSGAQITVIAEAAPAQAGVVLRVRDNGCGMSDEVRQRCLEPFYTTKDRPVAAGLTAGTGLGLSLAHAIVERVGGSMDIESAPGKGTCVKLHLPAAAPQQPPNPSTSARRLARLTVENKRTRALVGHLLDSLQYDVRDGSDADAMLWVADGSDITPEAAAAFLGHAAGRRVVVIGEPAANGLSANGAGAWPAAGVVVCPRSAPFSSIRAAIEHGSSGGPL